MKPAHYFIVLKSYGDLYYGQEFGNYHYSGLIILLNHSLNIVQKLDATRL